MTKVIKELANADTWLRMLDTHDKVSFFDWKPDIVICPANYASSLPAAWYIVAIGDVKERRSGQDKFEDDEIGKIIYFLQDLLRTRPDRTTATGFLTDSYIIQFFRVHIVSNVNCEVEATRPYYLKRPADGTVCGGDWLHSLLQENPFTLGAPTIELSVEGSIVEITRYLGEGSSSVVWQGKHKEREVVVKIFRAGHEHDLEAEKRNLVAIKDIAGVTKYVASDGSGGILLLSPVGTPFSSHGHEGTILPSAEHFAQLVCIVEAAHKHARLLHRDLSLNNFFLDPDGKVFLNDWAAAVPLGEARNFFGALNFAADDVLKAYPESIVSQPCHDLEMIVKVMFACVHPAYFDRCFRKLGSDSKKEDLQGAIARWQDVRKVEHWKLLFEAAQRADYAKLQHLIFASMLSVPADRQQRSTPPAADARVLRLPSQPGV